MPTLEQIRAERARRKAEQDRIDVERNADAIRARCKTLAGFIREAWHVVEPTEVYVHGWHIDAICLHLEAITFGKYLALGRENRLIINVPPGTMKSLIVSVFWPAFEWGPAGLPSNRFISTSYSDDFVARDSRRMRDLVNSDWYKALWPSTELVRRGETSFENVATGWREGMPFKSLTGGRAHRLLIDDPHSVDTAESDTQRKATIRTFREAVPSRMVDPASSAIVVIMQRLHVEDVTGVALALGLGYDHLMLPMEFEPDRRCRTALGFIDPRTYEGELLFPERFSRQVVERDKIPMGSYAVAGQFQQRPTLREGGLFKRGWFNPIKAAPIGTRWVRAWDLAATKEKMGNDPAYTAGVKIGRAPSGRIVIGHVARERDEGAEIRKLIKATAKADGPHTEIGLPKDPGQAGKTQAQDMILMLAGYVAKASPESGDKVSRAEPLAAQAEAGNVDMVIGDWNETFLDEATNFPGGKYKDQVDAASRGFMMLLGETIFGATEEQYAVEPVNPAKVWGRVAAMVTDQRHVGVVWGAYNRLADTLYVIDEYMVPRGQMPVHAEAVRKRGRWVPVLFEQATDDENTRTAHLLADLSIDVFTVPLDLEAGVQAIAGRLGTSRMKVFNTNAALLAQFRRASRDDKGQIANQDDLLIRATALLAMHGPELALSEAEAMSGPPAEGMDTDARSSTGY